MPDYDPSLLDQFDKAAKNPAAPLGAKQVSEAAAGAVRGDVRYDSSKLAQWGADPMVGMTGAAQSWYSGANAEGPMNGWSTDFVDTFFAQQDEAEKEGTLGTFFDRDGATGLVTWNQVSQKDPEVTYKYGDIYEGGEKKGNVYDLYDLDTANLMMSTFVLDAKEKKEVFEEASFDKPSGGLRNPKLDDLLQTKRVETEATAEKAFAAMAFEGEVSDREKQLTEGGVGNTGIGGDEAIVAAGGVGGAALAAGGTAAAFGSVLGPVGTAVAGAGGALFGAGAAWLNKDSLTEQAARAYEITAMSREEFGLDAGIATGVGQWSKFGMKSLSPFSNAVQGGVDAFGKSQVGDGDADFYRTDASGKRTVSKWVIGADVGATVGDALLQFASPLGLAAYSGTMAGSITGDVAQIGLTGSTFDQRRGGFDNIFTDDQGNFDASSAAAGIGSVGIDAVQLGFARGLAGKVNSARAGVGDDAAYGGLAGVLPGSVARNTTGRLPRWLGGQSDKAAIKAAGATTEVRIGGFAYTIDDATGAAVSRRGTLSLLAPSEALSAVSTGAIARRAAARQGGAFSADDVYKTATALASGERKVTTTLVNAFGEGGEELVQSALEPLSHNANIDAQEMYLAAAYGFASGVGMGTAAAIQMPNARQVLEAQALQAHTLMTQGGRMDPAQLKAMSDNDLRTLVGTMSSAQREVAKTAYKKSVDSLTATNHAGVAGLDKLMDSVRAKADTERAKANPRFDGSFVITPLEGAGRVDRDGNMVYGPDPKTGLPMSSIPSHGIGSSAAQLLANYQSRQVGLQTQLQGLEREIARLTEADQSDPDIAAELAKATRDSSEMVRVVEWMERVNAQLEVDVDRIMSEADPAARAASVAVLNHQLRAWFDLADDQFQGQPLTPEDKTAIARAVTMIYARDPHDSSGSYQAMLPQASLQLTVSNADNVLQVSSGILKAIRGDHDGDKLRPQNALFLDADTFTTARSGGGFIGTATSVHVDPPKNEQYTVEAIALATQDVAANPALAAEASATLINIGTAVKRRYGGRGVDAALDKVLERFYEAVRANTDGARAVLLDGLASEAGSVVTEVGRESLSNEWLWLDQVVRSNLQAFQEVYASHQALPAREADDLNLTAAEIDRETSGLHLSTNVKTRRARRAATFGQTMGMLLVGDSPFRMFQKLHYSSMNAAVLDEAGVESVELWQMAAEYERLGQLITETELERVRGIDEIQANVLAALDILATDAVEATSEAARMGAAGMDGNPIRALTKHEALVVLANTAVRDFNYDPASDTYTEGGVVSLTQMLLKIQVQRDQEAKREILSSAPSLAAKHSRLLAMTRPGGGRNGNPVNAEKAFVEVFGSQQLGVLLGEEADVFGPQLTVEQFVRMYVHMSEDDRRNKAQELTNGNPAYLGRNRAKNVPYLLEEMTELDDGKTRISPSRSVIDSILAVGNNRITVVREGKRAGHIDGEYADRSARVSKDFVDAHRNIRGAMYQMLELNPKNDELTVELVQRIIEQNPDFARKVMELIPNSSASVVFEVRDGQVFVNNWFYEMLTETDGKAAEMIYWRAVLVEGWRAQGIDADDDQGLEYSRLKRRMHRVMYHVAPSKTGDEGVLEATFLEALWSHTNVDDFVAWVNRTPGMRRNEAPLVPWFDDVAEFDVDKANGGWSTSLEGAELREAIKTLNASAGNLLTDLVEERSLLHNDLRYLRRIEREAEHRAGRTPAGYNAVTDRAAYDAMEQAIARAGEAAVSLGPHAMVFQSVANAWGFYGQAHNKGKNPAHVEAYGMFDARRDAFGFVHNYSRVMGALTAVDIEAVGSSLDMVAKDSGRTMDDFGRVIEWGKPTVEQMVTLMKDPETRGFARALVQPTVLERTEEGGLSEQLLLGKSLEELLEGKTYRDLFGQFDKLGQSEAFKYLSLVESGARKFNGHMSVSRAVNDIVIARLNASRQTLSFEDVESLVTEAYYEVARLLQKVGELAAAERVSGTNTLADVLDEVKTDRRAQAHAARKGIFGEPSAPGDPTDMGDQALQMVAEGRKQQHLADINELTQAALANPARRAEIEARILREEASYLEFEQRFATLMEEDEVGPIVAAYSIPENGTEQEIAAVRRSIVEFVDLMPSMRERTPAVLPQLMKLQWQLSDPDKYGEVDMTDAEWDELSRAVIGVILTDSAGPVGAGVSVRLYPDAKAEADRRYYDRSFSYLIDPLLDPKSPIVQAAADLNLVAKRHDQIAQPKDIGLLVATTVFDDKRLGPWTEDVVVASVEANQRIDSAAAAQAVAISGQSPKLEATVSAATERTFVVPGDDLLSTVSLTARSLELTQFDEVDVAFPGGAVEGRPLAQLNNRFARSVVMHGAGLPPEGVDLLLENADLGRTFYGPGAPTNTGLVEIHPKRIAEALKASAAVHNVNPHNVQVDVAFFHPETQPSTEEFYNNVWFEGTSFELDADQFASLNESLWFALGSLSPEGQAAALDAAKKGQQAMQVIKAPTAAEREAAEIGWENDLAGVLRRKTQMIMETDLGFGVLDPEFYNAVLKGQKLRHFVLGTDADGARVVWSAEQVIEAQRLGQGLPFTPETLWTPSDRVLRSMLGEQGEQGVARIFDEDVEFDTFRIPKYRGVSAMMRERFARGLDGETASLTETKVVHRPRQSRLVVRPVLPRKTRDQFAQRMRRLAERRDQGYYERSDNAKFDRDANLKQALDSAFRMLKTENLSFAFDALGIPFIGPRDLGATITSTMVLKDLNSLMEANDRRTGWILRNNAPGDIVKGVLGQVPLDNAERPGLRILLGDLVVVELDSYGDDFAKVSTQLDLLAEKGATVVLGDGSGGTDLMGEAAAYLQSLGFERVAGSKHAYKPRESNSAYVVKQARESTLTTVEAVRPSARTITLNVRGLPMQEGGAFLNPRAINNRGAVKVVADLVPTSSMGGFGVPRRQLRDDDQMTRVIRHLRGMDNPLAIAMLQEQSHGQLSGPARDKADRSFEVAWRRMMERFDTDGGGALPAAGDEFRIGDMIPLVDGDDRVVIYRHGHKRPDHEKRKQMFRTPVPGREGRGANVAVYTNETEPAATTHTGTVVGFTPRAGYGLSVELEVPLQMFGNKEQLQWDGTKYTIVPWPAESEPGAPVLPAHSFLRNRDIDIVSDLDTRLGKQGTESMVTSHRNAFALFGIDFLPDLSRFFFGKDDFSAQQATRQVLDELVAFGEKITVSQAHQLLRTPVLDTAFLAQMEQVGEAIQQARGVQPGWVQNLGGSSVEAQIATAMIVYLSTPGAKVSDVLRSGSFDDTTSGPDAVSIKMPSLFTQVFDDAPIGSELRGEINRRLNARINQAGAPGESYRLLESFDFMVTSATGQQMQAIISFPEVHSSGDNPVTNGMSYDDSGRQQVSAHSAMVAAQALGARTFSDRVLAKATKFKEAAFSKAGSVERFTPGVYDDGAVWRMMTNVPAKDRTYDLWSAPLPAEIERNGLAYDAMVQFRKAIDRSDGDRWSDKEHKQYDDQVRKILDGLNLDQKMEGLVDGWVRQMLGRPAGMKLDGVEIEPLSGRQAIEAAGLIYENVAQGYNPVFGGFVPVLHVHDLKLIFRSNRNAAHPFVFRGGMEGRPAEQGDWDDWVHTSLGGSIGSGVPFEMYYLLPSDGFMHSYQSATRDLTELPVSLSVLVNNQVLRLETNDLLEGVTQAEINDEMLDGQRLGAVPSLDPTTTRMLTDRIVLDTARSALADLLNGQRIAGEYRGDMPPASEMGKQTARIARHRKQNGSPTPVLNSMKDFRQNSTEMMHHTTTTNAMVRGLINLRVGMALFNPALYVSMPIEQGIRGSLDRVANILVGQSTTGATTTAMAKTSQRLADTKVGRGLAAAGFEHSYTPEQLVKLNALYRTLATDPSFKSMIYGDLTYQRPYEPGSGRISHALEQFAKSGSKLQDPTYGMRDLSIARRYVEPALQDIMRRGTLTGLSVDSLIDQLSRNPMFLRERFPEVHQGASNSLAQIRSLKQTPLSLALRWVYEPLSQNGNSAAANIFGNVVLRLPMIFSTYAGNVATTILGLQGLSDMTAMMIDGRNKGPMSMFGRIAALMRGEKFSAEDDAKFDMSSVLEGIDLSRSFLRGSLTHTGLFTFALMAGGLGLSGEDEEAKRRRRANELQGAGMIYDPRKIENDFRNADALYLDWLPLGLDSYFKVTEDGRAMTNVHWMLRQFISPIIGIEKFVETGNFQHVKWGFMDALGSFPLINSNTVTDTLETMALFEKQAADLALEGTDEANIKAAGLLTSIVGGYERMLFENSFVNAVYAGIDEYDRDPYAQVMLDSDGQIQRDAQGNPRQSETLKPYVDPVTGEQKVGYQGRTESATQLGILTENRMSMALVSMLFTGTDSEYWRYNMVPKTREQEKETTTEDYAREVLRSAFIGGMRNGSASAMPNLSLEEARYMVKGQFMDSGATGWDDADVEAQAKQLVARAGIAQLSSVGPDGREYLTRDGARGVIRGLRGGTVQLGDEALRGVYISREMRLELQDEMMQELVAEGVAMGMTPTSATYRMKRLWMGPMDDSKAVGIGDLLWSDKISYSDTAKYYQLNTTYVMGPDGRPWATGFRRDAAPGVAGFVGGLLGAAGVMPLGRQHGAGENMKLDNLHNVTNQMTQTNTGLRGLVAMPEMIPTDIEIGKSIEEAIERAAKQDYTSSTPAAARSNSGYGGWRNFGSGYGGYRRRSYGGGGGYSSSGYPNFTRMYGLPQGESPYGNAAPFINTTNPILRRGDVRRERVWSDRGRLNQWQ